LFLSGSLALAIILLSIGGGFNVNLFSYLFGSLVTVSQTEVYTIIILAALVMIILAAFYKELFYISFDEEVILTEDLNQEPVKFTITITGN
jgi:zinc transport system permease protein